MKGFAHQPRPAPVTNARLRLHYLRLCSNLPQFVSGSDCSHTIPSRPTLMPEPGGTEGDPHTRPIVKDTWQFGNASMRRAPKPS